MRKLLLFFAMLFVSVGTWAAITITSTSVSVGGTTYSGYGIYGAKAGELALLLSGDNSVTVQWNGANLNQLKSAEFIKVGDSQNPNVLKDEDLEALQLLSGAKFLDIDGSTLADGADISKIKAGSAIEAVTLPNNLTKEQVNGAGASLTACNSNFGSCLSLDAEMGEKEIYVYTHPCSSEEIEYNGTVTGGTGHLDNITCPLTFTGSSFTYINTKFNNEVTACAESEVEDGKVVPSQLKVELTAKKVFSYNGTTYDPDDTSNNWWYNTETGVVTNQYGGPNLPVGTQLDVSYKYTYKWRDNYQDEGTYTYNGEPQYDETYACYYAMIDNSYTAQAGYQFDVTSTYNYTYSDPTNNCNVATISFDSPKETTDIPYNQDVALTAKTITAPVEGGKTTAIAYVNKAGSLYKATSLDVNDAKEADALVISGNINNGDISQGGNSGNSDDPQGNQHDSDAYESNGAISAFYFNPGAPIKSVDMSDAVIDDYKHLRVLNAYDKNLESVVFPKTVTRIPNYCCYSGGSNGCYNLTNVVFPTEAASFTIGDYAFRHTPITSLVIPSGVTQIGAHAFEACDQMTDVEMEALKNTCHFDNYVFANCSALKHVTLSEKVENIGDYQFNQCGLLESIRIPSTCETIGSYSFYECFSIHQMTIPEGVKLIKINAFELAGITDIYLMASTPSKLPKIYAMSPTGAGAEGTSTFTYQRTTGNDTAPQEHRGEMGEGSTVHYDEAMSWYQEEQSGPQGLGTGNCLTAIHYPESMKPFFEAFDVTKFYDETELAGVTDQYGRKAWFTPEEYLALLPEGERRNYVQLELQNKKQDGTSPAYDFGTDEEGNPILYQYIPQAYAVDAFPAGHNNDAVIGPDADGRYYPNQHDYWIRMVAGATGTEPGGVNQGDIAMPFASAWGWRQFPLATSVESIGEIPYEKEYDDTWYTMCFPWKMEDNQLFMAFNQKCEIVEFIGAEVLQDPEDEYNYNLVFHFDEVAKTYYMDDEDVEYTRERDGNRVDAAGHNLYIYTPKGGGASVSAPDPLPDKNTTDVAVKEQYGKYLSIKNIMVLPGHPYMIHPSIGAAPGNPAKVYINGVKKVKPGEGQTLADIAESQKVERIVTSNEKGGTSTTAWKNPVTDAGGKYTFIGNINDAVETDGVSDKGVQDMPTENGPVYFLGLKPGTDYPQYFKKAKGKGKGKWTQYSAIIVPDADAIANVEGLDGMSVGSGSGSGAKGFDVVFGEWEIVDEDQMATVIDNAVAEGKEKNEPAKIQHMNVVYNIKGQVVRSNSTSVEGLPKGLYIVNGKKYMVK